MSNITFADDDKFKRKKFADNLTRIITKFYPFHSEAYVLGLNAGYGAGKTTFLKMWKNDLESKGHKVIYINSWETDFDEEPLVPIISALLDQITSKDNIAHKLKSALDGALIATALTSNGILNHLTGVDAVEILEGVERTLQSDSLKSAATNIYKEYSFKKKAYEELREALKAYAKNLDQKPLIIFVDELDRVRPNYAVEFLEAIKHIFSVQGVCFVLAVNKSQLKASIEQLYGNVDFENYYLRFITREATLPDLSQINTLPFLKHLTSDYFDEKRRMGVTFAFPNNKQDEIISFLDVICRTHRFLPRQIEAYLRVFAQFMAVESTVQYAHINRTKAALILIAIMHYNPSLYKNIGIGKTSPKDIFNYVEDLNFSTSPFSDNSEKNTLLYYALAYILTGDNKLHIEESINIVLNYQGIDLHSEEGKAERSHEKRRLLAYCAGDSRYASFPQISGFQAIYTSLEHWNSFMSP